MTFGILHCKEVEAMEDVLMDRENRGIGWWPLKLKWGKKEEQPVFNSVEELAKLYDFNEEIRDYIDPETVWPASNAE